MKKVLVATIAGILLSTAVGIVVVHERTHKRVTTPPVYLEVDQNVKSLWQLREFFSKHETQNAEELAIALLLAPPMYRDTLAAIAVQESNGDSFAVGSSGEKGIFQVREKFWGRVPRDIAGQVLQASYIYATLHKLHGSEYRAVKAYNGSGYKAEKYAYAVLEMKGE